MSSVFHLIWKNLLFLSFTIIKRSLPSNVKIWWTLLEIVSAVLRLLMEEKHSSQIDRIQLYRNFGVKEQGDIVIARVDRKTGLEALLYSTRIIPYYYFSINTLWLCWHCDIRYLNYTPLFIINPLKDTFNKNVQLQVVQYTPNCLRLLSITLNLRFNSWI